MAGEPQGLSVFVVGADGVGERLDVYLARQDLGISRAKAQKLVEAGAVKRNSRAARSKDLLAAGDELRITWAEPAPSPLVPVAMALDILFEDEHLIVLNKPAGMSVHPGAGEHGPTLVQGLLYHCGSLSGTTGSAPDPMISVRPGIVHRLDKDTTGVLVCAKTDRAHAALAEQFQTKTTLRRDYTALLDGVLPEGDTPYASYLYRDPSNRLRFASMPEAVYAKSPPKQKARYAKSLFTRLELYGQRLSLANIRLFTGRTHQIRAHARALGLGVVGDQVYHHPAQLPLFFPPEVRSLVAKARRQMLHAASLGFTHPLSGEQCLFTAPLPGDFCEVLNSLAPFRWGL